MNTRGIVMGIISILSTPHSLRFTAKAFVCKGFFRRSGALLGLAAALLIAAPAGNASAQGFFDLFRPSAPGPSTLGYASPEAQAPRTSAPQRSVSSGTSHCVRLCDGRHFPIQHHANA